MIRWWKGLSTGGKLGVVGWASFVLWVIWDAVSWAL